MGSHSFAALPYLFILITVSQCHRLMGCYKEISITARLMNGDHKDFRGTLTPETCINYCKTKGFGYAGLQWAFQCFCSSERPSFKHFAEESECNSKCEGDNSQFCGGALMLSVYDIEDKRVNYVQANYLGCYADDGESRRALRNKASPDSNLMTPEYCAGYCYNHGYRYSGVQYQRQCFCGDEIRGERANEGECDQDCFGNPRIICGGNWRSSIYHTSITDKSEAGRLLGCFIDSENLRLLSGHKAVLRETNSPRRCLNICLQLGFSFSGVQDGVECFCGNKKPDKLRETNENECLGTCPNSNLRACGGGWRLAIYSTSSSDLPPLITVPAVGNQVTHAPANPSHGQLLSLNNDRASTTTTRRSVTTKRASLAGSHSCPKSQTEAEGKVFCKEDLIFHEKFDSWTPGIWKHEIFMPDEPDYEFVVFDDNSQNIFHENGLLVIKPTTFDDEFVRRGRLRLEDCTGRMFTEECEREGRTFSLLPPARSARISTKESFSFKYGKVRIRARLPAGDWLVPEIWLEPKSRIYGPVYQSGRIRIAHSFGNRDLNCQGHDLGSRMLESGILLGTESKVRGIKRLRRQENQKSWYEDFHNYTLIWTPDNIAFQVDDGEIDKLFTPNGGKLYTQVGFDEKGTEKLNHGTPLAPFDQEFYISIGVSVGGMREFPDNCVTGQDHAKPWRNRAVKGLVDFWNDRNNWQSTWNNKKFGLYVSDLKVYSL